MAEGNDIPGAGGDFNGGDGQDVCSFFASIINQRQSVERLLNWLRQSQQTCTDSICSDDISDLPGLNQGGPLRDSGDQLPGGFDALQIVLFVVAGFITLYAMNVSGSAAAKKEAKPLNSDRHDRYRRDRDDDQRPAL